MKIGIAKAILEMVSSRRGIQIVEEMAKQQGKTASKLIKIATNKVAKGNIATVSTANEVLAGYVQNARGFATVNPLQGRLIENSIREATMARQSFGIREAEFSEWIQRHAKKMGINAPKYSGGKQQLRQESRILDETQKRQRVVEGWRPDNPFLDELRGKR